MSIDNHYYGADGVYRPAGQLSRDMMKVGNYHWVRITANELNQMGIMALYIFYDRIYVPPSVAKILGIL